MKNHDIPENQNANLTAPQNRPKIFLWVRLSQKKMYSKCLEEARKTPESFHELGAMIKKLEIEAYSFIT